MAGSKDTSGTYALLNAQDGEARAPAPKETCNRWLKRCVESTCFKTVSMLCLVVALFGGGVVTVIDLPDEVNFDVDVVMTSISAYFVLEIILRCITEFREYPFSFFFWMDVIGTLSMAFEISYLLGSAGKIRESNSNMRTVTVRSARAARIGARAGRLSRPLRLLNTLLKGQDFDKEEAGYSAKVLGARLTQVFSSKVAMLTVILVLGVPLFNIGRYPEDDFSIRSWGNKLEADYARDFKKVVDGRVHTTIFEDSVRDMWEFYDDLNAGNPSYFPFRLEGYGADVEISSGHKAKIPGAEIIDAPPPNRLHNVLKQTIHRCRIKRPGCQGYQKAAIYFDFTESSKYDAILDMAVTVFIVLCMLVESFDLNYSIDRMMVKPMERMLDAARLMGLQLNQALSKGKGSALGKKSDALKEMSKELGQDFSREGTSDGDDASDDASNEIEMLQGLFKKVILLINIFMEQDEDEMNLEEREEVSMVHSYTSRSVAPNSPFQSESGRGKVAAMESQPTMRSIPTALLSDGGSSMYVSKEALKPPPRRVSLSGATNDSAFNQDSGVESWEFTSIDLSAPKRRALADYCCFKSDVGIHTGDAWLDADAFEPFYKAVEEAYNLSNQYHNFEKAIDLLTCCHRMLHQMLWEHWLSDWEVAALLVAALGADIGHPGKSNHFLVETSHEFALKYNDKSPLENMHCAQLFAILTKDECNVYRRCERQGVKQARAVIIEAILSTDSASHHEMIKDAKKVYAMCSDLCDAQSQNPGAFASQYVQDVLGPNVGKFRRCILHVSDVSHTCQKFDVAQQWGARAVEELLLQGDEELQCGLPVGALRDRSKVTVPSSQFGYLNVLVTPLIVSLIHIFPMLHPAASQMIDNMKEWKQLWSKEQAPTWSTEMDAQQDEKITKAEAQLAKFVPSSSSAAGTLKAKKAKTALTLQSGGAINLAGQWTCTGTWGLEEFLKYTGVGWAKRKAALAAPWPSWEFQQSGDHIVFINNSAMGVLREEINASGEPFSITDGWKQKVDCVAHWENMALVIEKKAPQGEFREERRIDDSGKLQFSLEPTEPAGPKWGRSFERKKK